MKETTEQLQQNTGVQQLFPTSSSVQKPQTIWSGSQKQSYPQSVHGNKKISGFIQMQEEMHPEVTVHNAFRVLKCYGPALPLFLSDLSKNCSFHRQRLDQNHSSEHRHCDPGLNFTGAWWGGESKVGGSPTACSASSGGCIKGCRRGASVKFCRANPSLPDLPTSTHSLRFWASWRWPRIYRAAWASPCTFFFS